MSSILDALRKVEREKAESVQPVEVDFDEDAAERDLIGGSDASGHMVVRLSPVALMASGGAVVLLVILSAGLAWMWLHNEPAKAPVTVAAVVPAAPQPAPVVPAAPTSATPPSVAAVPAPAPAEPAPVQAAVAPPPPPAVVDAPPKVEPAVVAKAPTPEPIKEAAQAKPAKPLKEDTTPKAEAKAPAVEPKPAEKPEPEAPEAESTQLAEAESAPEPLPEIPKPVVVRQTSIGEPLKSVPRVEEPATAAAVGSPGKADEGAILPPSEEDRRAIKVNMPRPANKRNPYASAIINLQPVFLNETIPGTNAKLVGVRENGIVILKQDTGTRHFLPF